eukprot:NODE_678_length_1270_cov_91.937883_g639_i0.p1 GENE.NODE_678_length_1270_cov_91.937883_g639_i0~~NODE_678_length_1270_cov_91.937883_g639_i0.p1  ORF type:complete len:312 (+),score=10.32 NODE_678_length_1270_cov_91.937883_g639_i0:125-1060(+)
MSALDMLNTIPFEMPPNSNTQSNPELTRIGWLDFRLPESWDQVESWYSYAWTDLRDLRSDNLPTMSSGLYPLIFVGLYLLTAAVGRLVVSRMKPYGKSNPEPGWIKPTMMLYNLFTVLLSAYMAYGLLTEILFNGVLWWGNTMDWTSGGNRALWFVYVYYMSKYVEFSDTLFMLLRRKPGQITFLHVYHHASMCGIWWVASRFGGGADNVSPPLLNCVVHVIMYSYYLITGMGIQVPPALKRGLTKLQLIQFGFAIWFAVMGWYSVVQRGVNYPRWMTELQMVYMSSLVLFFLNFYRQSYRKRPLSKPKRQ